MVKIKPVTAGRNAGVEFGWRERCSKPLTQCGIVIRQEHHLRHAYQQLQAGQLQIVTRQADLPVLAGLAQQLSVGQEPECTCAIVGTDGNPWGFKQIHSGASPARNLVNK